ncbi:MAG: acyl-CoA dehydrogenase family protein [Hyphomicrobiaceae bacterium]
MTGASLGPDEREIIATVERFVAREVAPHAARHERDGTYPDEMIAAMRALGLFGIAVPEDYGGLGLGVPALARVFEALAKGWSTVAAYVNSHSTVAHAIARHGTAEQKSLYLPRLAAGDLRGSLCLTEPQGGSDLQAIDTRADVLASGGYRLTGDKIYITNGARAGLLLVLAKTDRNPAKPSRGMSLILVEKPQDGVNVGGSYSKMGFHQVDTVEILLDGAIVSQQALLGDSPGKGFGQLMESLEIGRIAIAASAVGVAASALAISIRYAAERKTFGKTINQHQAIQLRLAEMATRLVAAREITLRAAEEKQSGRRADMASAMAKLYASEAAVDITREAMRVLGGAGYITDYQVERLHREALLYLVGEGTNDINKLVIARRLLEGTEASLLDLPP